MLNSGILLGQRSSTRHRLLLSLQQVSQLVLQVFRVLHTAGWKQANT